MQQAAVFCKELSPAKTEHLMNRAREELHKLEKVTKAKKRRSSPEHEQSNSKAKVDVSSLIKAKKNEICASEENDFDICSMKKKKKKHKSKSKDYLCENNELNNTLSLGLCVNIELANNTKEKAATLNPKHTKTTSMKHASQDSALSLKENTAKIKFDVNKKQKGVRQANTESICRSLSQKSMGEESPEKIAENQENLETNNIDLLLSATVIKTDKRKKLKTMISELEETVCTIKEHRKKKSRMESSPLEEIICPEKIESSQNKRHKNDRNYDSSFFHFVERRKKTSKKVLDNCLLEMETEHKSKRKKKKLKDIQSEDEDKYLKKRENKKFKKDEEEAIYVDSNDMIKKTKKKKTVEHTESLDYSHNEIYCTDTVKKDKKHKKSRNTENVNESLTSDSSNMYRAKKKKHKDAKESGSSSTEASYGELKDNTEETNITETESYHTNKSPNKRKRTKHKKDTVELEVGDAEVCSNKKKKEKLTETNNGYNMDKQRRNKHREDIDECVEPSELQKKSKRKSKEEKFMQSVSELTESKQQSTKHKKKGDRECKDVEDTDYSSEHIQEININETSDYHSVEFLEQGKKVKRKRRSLSKSDEIENVQFEGETVPDVFSVVIAKNDRHKRRHGEECNAPDSSYNCENGQRKKKKKKKSKNKERERAEISGEINLSYNTEIHGEHSCTSQNVSTLKTPSASKANTTFGLSPMERLLYSDPSSVVTEACTHCSHCSHGVTAKPSPSVPHVVNTVNIKQEKTGTLQLQAVAVKTCVVENIVDTVVIKKEPGLETENSNSVNIEHINFIDINNLKIKQEPGLETETPTDQVTDPIQLKLPKDDEQKIECIKKEPAIETQNNLNAAVSSVDTHAPEAEQQLSCLKKEQFVEEHSTSANGTSAIEGVSLGLGNTTANNTYLNSVISTEDGASEFFRHAPKSANNITASEFQGICARKTTDEAEPPSDSASISKAEAVDTTPDIDGHVTTPQQLDISKHELNSKEASFQSEMSLVQYRQPALKEEWIYELHMIDVPYQVHFQVIADYFRVPVTKVREYSGYSRRAGYKHVVVSLSNYTTCLRMNKKRRLFGSRHTFIWSFKKYVSQDS